MRHGTIVRVRAVRGLTTLLSLCVVQPVEAEKEPEGNEPLHTQTVNNTSDPELSE